MQAKDREPLFQSLFENSPDAIFIEDMAGNVLDCNPAAAALHGIPRETLIGTNVADLVPPDQRSGLVTLAKQGGSEFEGWSLKADGTTIPVWGRTRPIQYLGQPALLLHVRDITNEIAKRKQAEDARRRLEEEIQAAHRMEAVGRLAGGVAHDFNNLLTVVIGRAEVLLGQLSNNHPMRSDLLLIYDAAQKAAGVTRQLLAFGRKQVLQPKILNLNSVIKNMDTMLQSLITENVHIKFDLTSELWSVEADRGQIEQVLMNLVVNALDAMPGGGQLRIQTANSETGKGRYVMFSVEDTGRGMDAETLSHIFEPFYTTKEKAKGSGLGLPTVYGIVNQSGGHITVNSEPGQGTVFKVYLPGFVAPAEPLDSHEREAPKGTETILVAEDADLIRQLTKEILEVRGYHVLEAASGEEALKLCESYVGTIHLTLTDVVMPGMSGRDVAERVVQMRPDMKVLLMSGYADEISKAGFLHPGLHFIEKPFTSNSLALKIREVLDNSNG